MVKLSTDVPWSSLSRDSGALLIGLLGLLSVCAILRASADVTAGYLLLPGLLFIIGFFAGRIAACCHLPKMTGYICVGALCGPYIIPGYFLNYDQILQIELMKHLAMGLIALMLGVDIRVSWLRYRYASMVAIVAAQIIIIPLVMILTLLLLQNQFTFFALAQQSAHIPAWLVAALFAIVCLANSPMVVMSIIKENKATGPLAETAIGVSVCKDVIVMVGFAVCTGIITAWSIGTDSELITVSMQPDGISSVVAYAVGQTLGHILLSIAVGLLIGLALAWLTERSEKRLPWLLIGLALTVAILDPIFHIEPLFCLLAVGFASVNRYPKRIQRGRYRIDNALDLLAMPVFIVFFVAIGLSLKLDVLLQYWYLVLLVVVVRLLAIYASTWVGTRLQPASAGVRAWAWTAMVPQAGVTLALAATIGEYGPWGESVMSILIAAVALHELIGPVLLALGFKKSAALDQTTTAV